MTILQTNKTFLTSFLRGKHAIIPANNHSTVHSYASIKCHPALLSLSYAKLTDSTHPSLFPDLQKKKHVHFYLFPNRCGKCFSAEAGTSKRVLINPDPWMLTANPVYGLQGGFASQSRHSCVSYYL